MPYLAECVEILALSFLNVVYVAGALFASVGVIQAVADIVSGSAFDVIYAETVHEASGAIFVVIAILYVFCAAIFT